MPSALRVRWVVAGLEFNGPVDSDGVQYVVSEEDGWSDSPAGTEDPRIITLRGWVHAPTWEARRRAEKKLAALCLDPRNPKTLWELRCTEETGDLTTRVRRDDKPQISINPGGYGLTFTLQLHAPDPRKYADPTTDEIGLPQTSGGLDWTAGLDWVGGLNWGTVVSSGSLVLSNPGSADSFALLRIDGSTVPGEDLPNPTIRVPSTGEVLYYADTLRSGEFVVFDTHPTRRTVRLQGTADRRVRAAGSRWFVIPPQTDLKITFEADSIVPTAKLTAVWSVAQW